MKIAEALTKIKDLKGKSAKLQETLMTDALFEVIEGINTPDLTNTISDLTQVLEELRNLKTKVDAANVKHGLADKIHEMEQLRYAVKSLEFLTKHKQESKRLQRIDYNSPAVPVLTVATYDVASLTERVDNMRNRIRQLDLELQKTNWQIDV